MPGPGERWRMTVRLSRPRGSVNFELFDYDGWLLAEEVAATGYVISPHESQWLGDSASAPHHQLRAWLRDALRRSQGDDDLAGLLVALTIGESAEIGPRAWRVLSDTGTNHLLIISGLHVGLVTAMCFRLVRWLQKLLRIPGSRVAAVSALLLAFGYGAIAGLGLPVQRALVMTTVALAGPVLGRNVNARDMFCVALVAVVLIDPLAPVRAGFWLSFGAVFVLVYAFAGRTMAVAGDWRWWLVASMRTQWVVFLGMAPMLALLVHQVSLVSFVVNLVAIPWIGLTVVPLLLLAVPAFAVAPSLGHVLVSVAKSALSVLWTFLEHVAAQGWVFRPAAIEPWQIVVALLGALVLLAPRGIVPRWPGVILFVVFLAPTRELAPGEVVIEVLDVGQGLSVLVDSRDFTLVYDAGPRYGDRFDAGQQVVTPRLWRRGHAHHVDALVVSHGDMDHAGGVNAITNNFTVGQRWAQAREHFSPCAHGEILHDGPVRFVLLPTAEAATGNDRSCMVLITSADFAVLLPGDIEAIGEAHLLGMNPRQVDVLLAPHHGSRSSSSPALINRLQPGLVIFSTRYGNRFGHPDERVLHRYRRRFVDVYNTAADGAVVVRYHPGPGLSVETARTVRRRFWYD